VSHAWAGGCWVSWRQLWIYISPTSYLITSCADPSAAFPRHKSASIAHSAFQPRPPVSPSCFVSAFLHTQGRYLDLPFLGQVLMFCLYAPSAAPYDHGLQKRFEIDLPTSLLGLSNNHPEELSILRLYLVHRRRKLGGAMQSRLYVES